MFSGIVQDVGEVKDIFTKDGILELVVSSKKLAGNLKFGDSVSIDGCCQTIVDIQENNFKVQAVKETLSKTNFINYKRGSKVNLEPSLKFSGKIEGHLVSGHVDSVGKVGEVIDDGDNKIINILFPESLSVYIAPKGSIAVNGVSLTVISIENNIFSFTLIPYSRENTNLGLIKTGDKVNLEIDLISRYLVNYLEKSKELVKSGK